MQQKSLFVYTVVALILLLVIVFFADNTAFITTTKATTSSMTNGAALGNAITGNVIYNQNKLYHASDHIIQKTSVLATVPCFDTDKKKKGDGIELSKRGSVTGFDKALGEYATWVDTCVKRNIVREYYCDPHKSNYLYYTEQACPFSRVCYNGACVFPSDLPRPCVDNDLGIKPLSAGSVKGSKSGKYQQFNDYCKNNNILVEYYCAINGYDVAETELVCDNQPGCRAGICHRIKSYT